MSDLSDDKMYHLKTRLPILIGERIIHLRKERKMTQTKLASIVGKDRQYIYKIEKGIVTINTVTLSLITLALNISLKDFFAELKDT